MWIALKIYQIVIPVSVQATHMWLSGAVDLTRGTNNFYEQVHFAMLRDVVMLANEPIQNWVNEIQDSTGRIWRVSMPDSKYDYLKCA